MNTTKLKAFAITGATGFAASKFVFDASTTKAVIVGVVIGAIAVGLISISFPTQQPVSIP